VTASQAEHSCAVLDVPEFLPAECVVLDEFLAPQELNALVHFTLEREAEFRSSEVVSPGVEGGNIDFQHRRSRVLEDLGAHRDVLLHRIQASFPRILGKLGQQPFSLTRVEAQITASNDEDFFHWHTDNSQDPIRSRLITFVYFFHREPKQFRGGELRIYDSQWQNGGYVPGGNYRTIVPRQNQMVLFVSSLAHEITPVECHSRIFADSRFTVNGWFHR
jgi:Rps23 Pro-64 3,4-dihydroxylase Tpa1-like proline 4-hydroxylase